MFGPHGGPVSHVTFSDNTYLCSGSRDNTVKLWDIETGDCLRENKTSRNLVRHATLVLVDTSFNPYTANHNNCRLLSHLLVILKVIFANSVDPDQQSDLGPHCLLVCKNRFEKFARIFSRRHKQMTFSDAGFLGVLRFKISTLK